MSQRAVTSLTLAAWIALVIAAEIVSNWLLTLSPWASWLGRAIVGFAVLLALWVPFIRASRRQR